jgi:hypothetical protein
MTIFGNIEIRTHNTPTFLRRAVERTISHAPAANAPVQGGPQWHSLGLWKWRRTGAAAGPAPACWSSLPADLRAEVLSHLPIGDRRIYGRVNRRAANELVECTQLVRIESPVDLEAALKRYFQGGGAAMLKLSGPSFTDQNVQGLPDEVRGLDVSRCELIVAALWNPRASSGHPRVDNLA